MDDYQWLEQFLEYDEWATSQLLEAVASLSPEQFTREFTREFAHEFTEISSLAALSSVRQQFAHLLGVTDRYRARMAGEAVPDRAAESFDSPQDLIVYHQQMRQRLNLFFKTIEGAELNRIEAHATRRGVFHATVGQTLLHMMNHATYHRGQIACLLKWHGVDFPDTDFIIWINSSALSSGSRPQSP